MGNLLHILGNKLHIEKNISHRPTQTDTDVSFGWFSRMKTVIASRIFYCPKGTWFFTGHCRPGKRSVRWNKRYFTDIFYVRVILCGSVANCFNLLYCQLGKYDVSMAGKAKINSKDSLSLSCYYDWLC